MSWQSWQISSTGQINIWIEVVFFNRIFLFTWVSVIRSRLISCPGSGSPVSGLRFSDALLWRHLVHLANFPSTFVDLATLQIFG